MTTDYRDTLNALIDRGWEMSRLGDFSYMRNENPKKDPFFIPQKDREGRQIVLLRHDIDHSAIEAHKMAEMEASLGIYSSYYVLTSDVAVLEKGEVKWWGDPKKQKEGLVLLNEMQGMGHEVGLHYDALGHHLKTGESMEKHLRDTLGQLRDSGLDIQGCAAHGSRILTDLRRGQRPIGTDEHITLDPRKYVSYNIWKDREVDSFEYCSLWLEDFGLRYEAYLIHLDWYYADGHTGEHAVKHPKKFAGLEASEIPRDAAAQGQVMQALFHPIKWKGRLD
jgi:hypothetical protein